MALEWRLSKRHIPVAAFVGLAATFTFFPNHVQESPCQAVPLGIQVGIIWGEFKSFLGSPSTSELRFPYLCGGGNNTLSLYHPWQSGLVEIIASHDKHSDQVMCTSSPVSRPRCALSPSLIKGAVSLRSSSRVEISKLLLVDAVS
jgi:hypothetical protein